MSLHISSAFNEDLTHINAKVNEMGGLCERMLEASIKAIKKSKITSMKVTMPGGNCNNRLENSRLQTGCFKTGHFEMPRFPCSELHWLDLTHL